MVRRTTRQSSQPWQGACRRALLCAGIAAALVSWTGVSLAAATGGADASASAVATGGSDASANGGFADFDRNLLSGSGQNTTDLSRFEHGNPIQPGTYNTDVYLNGAWVGRGDVHFAAVQGKASAVPCMSGKVLDMLGLHPAKLSDATLAQLKDPNACVDISSLIQGAA